MFFTSAQVVALLIQYKYWILFPISVIEGPIITMIGGALIALGQISALPAYLILILGDLVGDFAYYAMGRFGRHRFIRKWGSRFGLTETRVQAVVDHFEKHPGKTLLFGKMTHAAGMVVLVAAGIANISLWKFLWYNFLGSIPKTLILVLLGYFFGEAYNQINTGLNYFSGVVMIILVLVAGYFYMKNDNKGDLPI